MIDNDKAIRKQLHAGSPGRFDRLKEVAFVYAFGLKVAARDPR